MPSWWRRHAWRWASLSTISLIASGYAHQAALGQNACPPFPRSPGSEKTYVISANLDNDFFVGEDDSYTNGLRIAVSRPIGDSDDLNRELLFIENLLPDWLKFGYSNQFYNSRGFGSSIFTPKDTSELNPPADQRPYAGYLYILSGVETEQVDFAYQPDDIKNCRLQQAGAPPPTTEEGISSNFSLSTRHFESMELQIGWIGPHAYGEEILEAFHDIWPAGGNALGWQSRQIKDEPVINFFYNRVWTGFPLPRIFASSGQRETEWQQKLATDPNADRHTPPRLLQIPGTDFAIDVRPHAGYALGNLHTFGSIGTVVRAGFNIPDNIGPPLIRPALPGSDHFTPRSLTNAAF